MTWVDQEFASGHADWSTFNGNANITYADADSCVFVRWDAFSNANKLAGLQIDIGVASNWVRLFRIEGISGYFDGSMFGVGLRDSVGGKCLLFGIQPGGPYDSAALYVKSVPATLDGVTILSSARLVPNNGVGGTNLVRYLLMKHDGTNLRFSWSEDGQTFTQLHFESPTAHLDNAPDKLLLVLWPKMGPVAMCCDYVRDAETVAAASGSGIRLLEGGGIS